MRIVGRTDVLEVAFRNFANAPKKTAKEEIKTIWNEVVAGNLSASTAAWKRRGARGHSYAGKRWLPTYPPTYLPAYL
jgi:hypothetical protein